MAVGGVSRGQVSAVLKGMAHDFLQQGDRVTQRKVLL